MSEIKYENVKIGCITCKLTSKRPEKMLQMIFVKFFAMYSFTQTRLCQLNARNEASRRILTKMATSVFHTI